MKQRRIFILEILFIFTAILNCTCSSGQENTQLKKQTKMKTYNTLTEKEKYIILNKGTEAPFTGKFNDFSEEGIFTCRQCNAELYKSDSKFDGHCGWPAFDDEIKGAVERVPDADGQRIEIVCANCKGHLGHVFSGENFTPKNTRHCVNSISLQFKPAKITKPTLAKAYFAGGCFWGMEYYFQKADGVSEAISGYMGGASKNPSYKEICTGTTGHLEVVEVIYNPNIISFRELTKLFFEIHNPEQTNGQGPDLGSQYLSAAYYSSEEEQQIIKELIAELTKKGYKIATKIEAVSPFWKAEDYHQDYYQKNGHQPYCHGYTKRF